ncbi:hypothetical protein GTP20_21560 [Vibrio alginolyticus]|uniref:hypothetical protein n=1 Tax=Vibrio alginolyticus TaxID=663 RepID=UPI00215D1B1E|nr:hypothetical protein [Vibrio alginolyticus]EGQ8156793.1 hypothetical protein [Vibrio alginolyticus]EGQ8490561.1 hypothetical protein [Vibrio alginolyticus]EKP4437552.1 hypothetical protein [Vibrio alginolyticus]ELB2797138.1 hypothetical protein [Vibrio alginolyticus]MCR9569380.1 hypothetical protein [Vibrio alginolyticus]
MSDFDIANMIIGCTWLVSTLLFIRVSVKRIEKKMSKDGHGPVGWDRDTWGVRFPMYTTVLMRGKPAKVSLVDDQLILKYATTFDRVLAFVVTISFVLFLACGAIITWGPEEFSL